MIFKFLLLSFILYASHFQVLACFLPRSNFSIYVINNLPPNTEPLRLHCASKDNDLGIQTLRINQEFEFEFCLVPFITLFFCRFQWGLLDKGFDVFDAKHIPCTHHKCYWSARTDGIYFLQDNNPNNFVKKIDWD
ncbi:hypothetical protein DH2020_021582 [Rehmannia glutinosa]|uniref:S-protein homolog n=1 Tax=Rehmannia glutinosa TaxID=99300 RepID=A0ABR0WEP7_REHGL